jgi:hypothetical protein
LHISESSSRLARFLDRQTKWALNHETRQINGIQVASLHSLNAQGYVAHLNAARFRPRTSIYEADCYEFGGAGGEG